MGDALKQQIRKEQPIEPTFWNKTKLIVANSYEIMLIATGLAISIYQDDASSLLYQLLLQVQLFHAQKQMGKHTKFQRKLSYGTLMVLAVLIIFKCIYMYLLEDSLTADYASLKTQLSTLGMGITQTETTVTFDWWGSLNFEVSASIVTLLLVRFYSNQILNDQMKWDYVYVYHSEWLKLHNIPWYCFFLTLTVHTFFGITIIQMVVLGFMYSILFLQASDSVNHKKAVCNFVIVWIKRLLSIQLAFLALTEIGYVKEWVAEYPTFQKYLYVIGLLLDTTEPYYQVVTYIFLLCFIICFGQQYEATQQNYDAWYKKQGDRAPIQSDLKEPLLDKSERNNTRQRFSTFKKMQDINFYKTFVKTYLPFVCIWVTRFISLVYAYAYFGYPAFAILTWLLLSFMVNIIVFVKATTYVYLPLFSLAFFFNYFININQLFEREDDIFSTYGRYFRIPAVEVGGMVVNIIFLLLLMGTIKDMKTYLQNDTFKEGIFKKLSDKNSNFLWQLGFYILKRIHVPVLIAIFIFGLKSFNVFYIGLLYFFVVYVSSLHNYRQSGYTLTIYSSFFIWAQYLWALISKYFGKKTIISKVMTMITLQKYDSTSVDEDIGSTLNQYMEYSIPVGQWGILMACVFLTTINKFYRKDKRQKVAPAFENPTKKVTYDSTSEYYEAKCDFVLRIKFPNLAKILVKIQMIFSEMMIIAILIVQAFILAIQTPNLLYWFFLIFSFILQTSVMSANEESRSMIQRCITNSAILRIYSGIVLIAQIAYTFITDQSFLASYGFDDILQTLLSTVGLSQYLEIIGFSTYTGETSIAATFLSPILFYITAAILQDYFRVRLEKYERDAKQDQVIDPFNQSQNLTQSRRMTAKKGEKEEEEDTFSTTEKDIIEFEYEKIKFQIPYMIYQRINQWRIFDAIALNFHLVMATVTIFFCANWQISLFMTFYLICTVILCVRAAVELHRNGKNMQTHHQEKWNHHEVDEGKRNKISAKYITKESMTVDEAHDLNKQYMESANNTLLSVRKTQWNFQYWLLIISMIIMYPTPLLGNIHDQYTGSNDAIKSGIDDAIYWLFWCGLYVAPEDLKNYAKKAPIYVMLIVLIMEKVAQRWQTNRYGCTLDKIQEFKKLEEQVKKIEAGQEHKQINEDSEINEVKFNENRKFITIGEARQEIDRIESLYRKQTKQVKEQRFKSIVEMGISRKYMMQFRNGLKFIMEQLCLQFLLLSCANKSNIVSIFYIFLMVMFLIIKNKTTGMLYMTFAFGFVLVTEYVLSLTNLTYLNSPQEFPIKYRYYPCVTNTVTTVLADGTNSTSLAPDCTNYISAYAFPFPWFLDVQFLRENLSWAMFFSIDIDIYQVNDIWFDFINLALLTIYFFSFGNPINANGLKVSFSQTKSLEQALESYTKLQVEKKYKMKNGEVEDNGDVIYGEPVEGKHNSSVDSRRAADDSNEYFLGSTFYLSELKKNIFVYYFVKKMRYVAFIGLQIITVVMILTLAILCQSLMSIGYLLFLIPLIWNMTDFFGLEKLHQKGISWRHPAIISGPLLIYSFADISLQILFQLPSTQFEPNSGAWKLVRAFGFDKIFIINTEVKTFDQLMPQADGSAGQYLYGIESVNLYYLILKSLNLFFIFLQTRIYQSDAFWKFMRVDLRKLMSLASHYKRWSMTFRYNNWKLQKIITLQQRKKKMYEGVAELKLKVQHYQSQHKSLLKGEYLKKAELRQALLDANKPEEEEKKTIEQQDKQEDQYDEQIDTAQPVTQEQTQSASTQIPTGMPANRLMEKLVERVQGIKEFSEYKAKASKSLESEFKMSLLQDILDKDDEYFIKKEAFKSVKSKLGRCARWYFWLKKEHVNQIAFLSDLDEASRIKKQMEKGYRTLRSDLEQCMIADINLAFEAKKSLINKIKKEMEMQGVNKAQLRARQKKLIKENVTLEKMKKTQEFLSSVSIMNAVIGAAGEALFSKCATLSYIFMVVAHMLNAGMISIIYPFAVFGYALMEETRPGKNFWIFMLKYTVFILFVKFACQLHFWGDLGISGTYDAIGDWVLFGTRQEKTIFGLLINILPELLVLTFILGQIYYENLIGLWEQREIEVETISQAKERFLNSFNETTQQGATMRRRPMVVAAAAANQEPEQNPDDDEEELPYEKRIELYPYELGQIKRDEFRPRRIRNADDILEYQYNQTTDRTLFSNDVDASIKKQSRQFPRKVSFIEDQHERHDKAKEIKAIRNPKKKTLVGRFNKNPYFQRLFPVIKQAKPGIDLYPRITFFQFIICYYLIVYYTQMDARGTQNLENSSQFSFYMVIMIFIQTFVMILERYISRTNVMIVKKRGPQKPLVELDDKYLAKLALQDAPKSMTVKLTQSKTSDTMMMNLKFKQTDSLAEKHQDYLQITLEETKMTNQQVTKWLIQWVLLILYHLLVFWFFPLSSNQAIYGVTNCEEVADSKVYKKYGCYSFRENGYLVVFYLLFCYYFMLSALQIRHGYPDWRLPSSLTTTLGKGPFFRNLGFYNLPFLIELKTILDWCWSKTSLDLFQWLELAEINVAMFNNRNANKVAFEKPLGEKISRTEKCICGCFCLSAILFFLVGPFLFFSNLSSFSEENLVTDAKLDFSLKINDELNGMVFEYPMFSTDSPTSLGLLPEEDFYANDYEIIPETKFFDPTQVQKIVLMNSSDSEWQISQDYKIQLQQLLQRAATGFNESQVSVYIEVAYQFTRPLPTTAQITSGSNNKTLDSVIDKQTFTEFKKVVELNCSDPTTEGIQGITILDFIPQKLRLTEDATVEALDLPYANASLSYHCENYWSMNVIDQNGEIEGLVFITFSDLISSGFFSQSSLLAFYFSVALVVGTYLRKLAIYNTDRIFICDIPNSEPIRNLVQCIYIQRLEQNLKKEEELFFILFEILRSPELLKCLVGSSLKAPLMDKTKASHDVFK